jgi:hypothetical protein
MSYDIEDIEMITTLVYFDLFSTFLILIIFD